MKGAELVRQGEASRGCFLIRAGSVEARIALLGGGTHSVAQFRDGEMFGEMALIERGVVSATVVAQSNVDAWFVGRDDFRALVASREVSALETQRAITRALSDRLRVLNDRLKAFPAVEDRAANGAAPAADPLAAIKRSRHASFDWKAFLPLLPFFEGFDAQETDELVSTGRVLELRRGDWAFVDSGLDASFSCAQPKHAITTTKYSVTHRSGAVRVIRSTPRKTPRSPVRPSSPVREKN